MSTRTIHASFRSGDLISERAARRVMAHRRPVVPLEPTAALGAPPSPALAARELTPRPAATGPKILRRWSVAELIARAAAGPPVVA